MMKSLVMCADDFAVHEAASRGIVQLAEQGHLTATSVMVLSPRWPHDAKLLHPLRGQIDVGLHLDWTSEFALAAGHGLGLGAAMRRALGGGFDRATARRLIDHQLDAFEAYWHAPPDHMDGHQHVQQFAGIRQALVEAVAHRYPQHAPYLRLSRAAPGQRDVKSWIIGAMGAQALGRLAGMARIPVAGALSGIYDFTGGRAAYARHMATWLHTAPSGALMMCHPASQSVLGDEIGAARVSEFEFLSSAAWPEALASAQVQLVRGGLLYTCAP